MSDLVERLRKRADHWKQNKLGWLEYEIYDDAADLIQSQAAPIDKHTRLRRSPDSAWPLRREDGTRFYEPRRKG